MRILIQADGALPGHGEEAAWLAEEVRYLLARQGAVRLAHPDGPHDPAAAASLHTLSLEIPASASGRAVRLTLNAPDGALLEHASLGPKPDTRLGLIEQIAERLGAVAARNVDAGSLVPLIGTSDTALYDEYTRTHVAHLRAIRLASTGPAAAEPAARRLERFERMTRRDPRFARAWSALALAYLELRGRDEDALAKLADGAATRALELDPQLPEAQAALGRTRYRYGQWLEAEDRLIAALAVDPAAPTALEAYACFLLDLGRIGYAQQVAAQALGTVPGSDDARECLALAELAAGDIAAARTTLGVATAAAPAGLARARALVELAGEDEAAALAALAAATPRPRQAAGALEPVLKALDTSGSRAGALRALTRAVDQRYVDAATETLLGTALEQPDFVFNRLVRMRSQRQAVPLRLLWLPGSRYLREHPRFAEVIDQLGLQTYWSQRGRPDHCRSEPAVAGCV
ncbi:MAG TPA: hypothetical protein VLT59_13010 [Steroidobacteraceae bacterium]|nr:hypothetical protein [Steroidobacteraceae bacterium]